MRDELRRTLNTLNDVGLSLANDFVNGLAKISTYQRHGEHLPPPTLTLVTSLPRIAEPPRIERAREPHFIVNHKMETIAVSTGLQSLMRLSAAELLGHRWERFVDGDDELHLVRNKWLEAAQTHKGFTHTVRCRTGIGGIAFMFMRVEPFEHPATQEFEGFFGTVRAQTLPLTLLHSQERSA